MAHDVVENTRTTEDRDKTVETTAKTLRSTANPKTEDVAGCLDKDA